MEEPKSATSRRDVDLTAPMVEALRAHRVRQLEERLLAGPSWIDQEFVFTGATGAPIHNAAVRDALRAALKRAKLPMKRVHDLRHGAATIMVTSGEDPKTVAVKLWHADVGLTLRRYVNPSSERRREAAERLSAVLAG